MLLKPIALIMAKTLWSFGHSECNCVKVNVYTFRGSNSAIFMFASLRGGGQPFKEECAYLGANPSL